MGGAGANHTSILQHMGMAFGTPIVAYPWPDSEKLNAHLKALILEKEKSCPGDDCSNVGGWHSQRDFFDWDAGCVRTFKQRADEMIITLTQSVATKPLTPQTFRYRLEGWANVNRHGAFNRVHDHPNCFWSGVYYVDSGEAEADRPDNGKLELIDPRVGVNVLRVPGTLFEGRYVFDPSPGLMVMFPSWLQHYVHPFFGKGERISIAFNAKIPEATT